MNLSNHRVEHPYLDIMALVFAAVVVVGSIIGYTGFRQAEQAKAIFADKQKTASRTIAEFDRVMAARDEFLTIAANADATMTGIAAKVADGAAQKAAWNNDAAAMQASYNAEVAAIKAHNDAESARYKADPRYTSRDYWTFPSSPGSPAPITIEFSAESAALAANAAEVAAFKAALKKTESGYKNDEVTTIYRDLFKSVDALDSALKRGTEILGQMVTNGKEGQIVNMAKADLIKYNSEDEWLKACRIKAEDFIKANNLDLIDYDVPGGTDANPQDKSLL